MPETHGYVHQFVRKLGFSEFTAETAEFLLGRPLAIVLILLGAFLISRAASRLARTSVEALVARSTLPGTTIGTARVRTLAGVAASLVRIMVWAIALLLVLEKAGINLGPLLAGASIVGVALGFGAQSLVRDFLSGFFILAEDQFAVGDQITIGDDTTGTVEEVNFRMTRLRSADGTVWFVPNGEIRKVGNAAKEWSRAIVDVLVPPGADMDAARTAAAAEMAALGDDPEWSGSVLEAPEVLGVESVGPDGAVLRVAAKTDPAQRARVARELRGRTMARLRAEGILTGREGAVPPSPSPPPSPPPSSPIAGP